MLIRTFIVTLCLSFNCLVLVSSWTGIQTSPDKRPPCSRRARRPSTSPPGPTPPTPSYSHLPPPSPSPQSSNDNKYSSDNNKYSRQLPPTPFRLLLPKNLDQPLDLYLESLAIKSEVIEGPEVLSQGDGSKLPTNQESGHHGGAGPSGQQEDDQLAQLQQIIAQLLAKNDKFFYKMPPPPTDTESTSNDIYKIRDAQHGDGNSKLDQNIESSRGYPSSKDREHEQASVQEYSAPPVTSSITYSRDPYSSSDYSAPAPSTLHHSVQSGPRPRAPYDPSLKPTQYIVPNHVHDVDREPRTQSVRSSLGRGFNNRGRGGRGRSGGDKYYFDTFKRNLGSGMKSFASYVKESLKSVKRDEEEMVDDNLSYNYIPVSSSNSPTIAMMSQSMASIHRSSPLASPPSQSTNQHSFTATSNNRNHNNNRQTTNNNNNKNVKRNKKPSFKHQNQRSNHHHSSQSRGRMSRKEPEGDEHHLNNSNNHNNNSGSSEPTINSGSVNNNNFNYNEKLETHREKEAVNSEESVAFLGRNHHNYRYGEDDDLPTKRKVEISKDVVIKISSSNENKGREADDEQTRINKEILFPLFDSILSQSEVK